MTRSDIAPIPQGLRSDEAQTNRRSMDVMAADRNALVLAGLRIAVGFFFLVFGEYKVFGTQFTLQGGFQGWIYRFLQDGAYPFMAPVLREFVLPHGTALAFLVAYGELAIGLALTLGIRVRMASAFGFIYMMSLLFSSDYPGANAPLWHYLGGSLDHSVLALCFLTFAFSHADQRLSVAGHLTFRKGADSPRG